MIYCFGILPALHRARLDLKSSTYELFNAYGIREEELYLGPSPTLPRPKATISSGLQTG